jgi:peptidoglycan/LPS O-acetylase OafA/YrhL
MSDVPVWAWVVAVVCEIALGMLLWRCIIKPTIRQIVREEMNELHVPFREQAEHRPRVALVEQDSRTVATIKSAIRTGRLGGLHG